MPITPDARQEIIARELKARDNTNDPETLLVPWRDAAMPMPVIKVPLDAVILNPRSHRIKANLEAHDKRHIVDRDPESEEAQEIIANLLRDTDDFEDLRVNLKEEGQREAGVVTRTGLLVNANTRLVALRDIEAEFIRVAVLPEGTSENDIDRVELRLQMARDFRRDYTFTNQLLFVEDLRLAGYSREKIARMLGYAASSDQKQIREGIERVEQETRLLALIREVQAISERRVRLPFFDNKRQALSEIDKSYEALKRRDPEAALRLRNMRLAGLFLEQAGYRELRRVDPSFFDEHVAPAMSENENLRSFLKTLTHSSGAPYESGNTPLNLDLLGSENADTSKTRRDPRALLRILAASYGEEEITLPNDSDGAPVSIPRDMLVDGLTSAFDEAITEFKQNEYTEDKLRYPLSIAEEVDRKLRRAIEAYERVATSEGFALEEFHLLSKKIGRSLRALQDGIEREQARRVKIAADKNRKA